MTRSMPRPLPYRPDRNLKRWLNLLAASCASWQRPSWVEFEVASRFPLRRFRVTIRRVGRAHPPMTLTLDAPYCWAPLASPLRSRIHEALDACADHLLVCPGHAHFDN